jgi:RNA 3'-terminal phosphate cyclase
VPSEQVAADAVNQLVRNIESGGCVDEYLQDQVVMDHSIIGTIGLICDLEQGYATACFAVMDQSSISDKPPTPYPRSTGVWQGTI